MSGIYIPANVAEKQQQDDIRDKTAAAFQFLMRRAYFNATGDRRQLRYDLIRALSRDMLGDGVDYEVLT